MPGFNQRGPEGQGPMTGRRMGRCTNFGANLKNQNNIPSDLQSGDQSENFPARGFGFGRGRGNRGSRLRFQNRLRGGV